MVPLSDKNWQNLGQFKGCYSGVPIYLDIYLGRDIMPLSIVSEFHENEIYENCVTKRADKLLILQNCGQFKGHNPGYLGQLSWLLNLGEILCL